MLIAGTVIALPFINRSVFGTDAKEVNVSTLALRVISPSILASGFLTHEEEVMLSSEVIGKVSERPNAKMPTLRMLFTRNSCTAAP